MVVFAQLGLSEFVNTYETGATKSEQFARHLRALDSKPQIVLGSRTSLYAPLTNLGAIVVWDEGDEGHQDESSPYLHSRDVALVRQTIEDCKLVFKVSELRFVSSGKSMTTNSSSTF